MADESTGRHSRRGGRRHHNEDSTPVAPPIFGPPAPSIDARIGGNRDWRYYSVAGSSSAPVTGAGYGAGIVRRRGYYHNTGNLDVIRGGTMAVSGGMVAGVTLSGGMSRGAPYFALGAVGGSDFSGQGANFLASHYAAVMVNGAGGGGYLSAAEAMDSASLAVLSGGTLVNGTAGSGGAILAAADGPGGMSLLSNAEVQQGGAGVLGAGTGFTVSKNGSSYNITGDGLSIDSTVDAGGLMVAKGGGTFQGGLVAGALVAESQGLVSGAVFSGLPRDGVVAKENGWIDYGAMASDNTVMGGAILGFNGGTGVNNTAMGGGILEANYGLDIYVDIDTTGSGSTRFGSVYNKGTSIDAVIGSKGTQIVNGGVDSGADVSSGGVQSIYNGGTAVGDHVLSGGVNSVYNGGTSLRGVVLPGGVQQISAGGYESGATLYGGTQYVSSGGRVYGGDIVSGGTEIVYNGGYLGGATAYASAGATGQIIISSGATADTVSLQSGGIGSFAGSDAVVRVISVGYGGSAVPMSSVGDDGKTHVESLFVSAGQTLYVGSGGYVRDVIVGPGETDYEDIGAGASSAFVGSGATVSNISLGGGFGSGTSASEMGGMLTVQPGATLVNVSMGNYASIEIAGVQWNQGGETVSYKDGLLTVTSGGEVVWSTHLKGSYNSKAFQIWQDQRTGNIVVVYDTCFLKGTLIETDKGMVAVENLKKGDLVAIFENGERSFAPITETRRAHSDVNADLPLDLAGWCVCVRKGAFGDNIPERDLRVTAEHSFYLDGRLVPVRMLVNGKSIYFDTQLKDFEFYHIATDPHSIINAEGALTESWLDTGERRVIGQDGALERVEGLNWQDHAAAPLDVSQAFVEPLWKKFDRLANDAKIENYHSAPATESDPRVRLRLDNGRLAMPSAQRGNLTAFEIPVGRYPVAVESRVFRPSETVGPWIDDRRILGVLVGKISVNTGFGAPVETNDHFTNEALKGWDVLEQSPCRWTKGNAQLPDLSRFKSDAVYGVTIEILAGGPYVKEDTASLAVG